MTAGTAGTAQPINPMSLSIFRPYKSQAEKSERYRFIHYVFKYKFFLPFCKFAEWLLRKYMVRERKDIPDQPYNENMQILWDSFEEAVEEWWFKFKDIEHMEKDLKYQHIENWVNRKNIQWYWLPKFVMRLYLTIMLEDTAYREQFNFLMFRLQGNMNKHHNPEIQHKWPMYTGMYDMNMPYFIEFMKKKGMLKGDKLVVEFEVKQDEHRQGQELEKSQGGTVHAGGTAADNIGQTSGICAETGGTAGNVPSEAVKGINDANPETDTGLVRNKRSRSRTRKKPSTAD